MSIYPRRLRCHLALPLLKEALQLHVRELCYVVLTTTSAASGIELYLPKGHKLIKAHYREDFETYKDSKRLDRLM